MEKLDIMYGRGSVAAAGTASALFAAVNIGTIGKIVAAVAGIVGAALAVRGILFLRSRA
jgi:hypothetical protein